MDFLQLTLENLEGEAAEVVADVFNRYGYGGAVMEMTPLHLEKVTVRTVIPAGDEDTFQKIDIALALISQALPRRLPPLKTVPMGENDWAESWKENFHVVQIGRVVIQPSWREYTPQATDVVVHLDPGVAFGSGLHPTTSLCLKILQSMPLNGVDMFDVGTGSGILTIAAVKMGASPVRAVDVDDVAVRVARENFELNGLSGITTAVGSAEENGGKQWSLVVANILSNILIDIMADLKAALADDGQMILSGIINEQEQAMLDCLTKHRLTIVARDTEGDWIALVVKK